MASPPSPGSEDFLERMMGYEAILREVAEEYEKLSPECWLDWHERIGLGNNMLQRGHIREALTLSGACPVGDLDPWVAPAKRYKVVPGANDIAPPRLTKVPVTQNGYR